MLIFYINVLTKYFGESLFEMMCLSTSFQASMGAFRKHKHMKSKGKLWALLVDSWCLELAQNVVAHHVVAKQKGPK
jgi:hypothetical protein